MHGARLAGVIVALAVSGCAAGAAPGSRGRVDRAVLAADLARTRPAGVGPRFRPAPVETRAVADRMPVGGLRCQRRPSTTYAVHLELFAAGRGIVIPGGIGIAPPQRRAGPLVLGGRCEYPLRTTDPTGVVLVERSPDAGPPTLGQLFALWGQPLSRRRLGAFRGAVRAYVDGIRQATDPRAIRLTRHAQIVLETGPLVIPHASYQFPSGQ